MGDVIKFLAMFILLLFMLNPAVGMKMVPWTIGFQMLPLIVGLAVTTGLIVGAARLYISGKPLAIMGIRFWPRKSTRSHKLPSGRFRKARSRAALRRNWPFRRCAF